MINLLKRLFASLVLAGLFILGIGLYYLVLKAGLPFQDPTPEIQLQYLINTGIGEVLTKTGLFTTIAGALFRIITGIVDKRYFPTK